MDEEQESKSGFLDISQYSERTRKIIFGAVVAILLAIMAVVIFVISPRNDAAIVTDTQPITTATQAAVDNETSEDLTNKEAVSSKEDAELLDNNGVLPQSEADEAAIAQKKIIEESLAREAAQTDKTIEDTHADIPNVETLKTLASKGMLEYCTDNPGETKEQKQERMKPYFHTDNSYYQSPQGFFYLTKCSVEGITEPAHEGTDDVIVYVGVAWGTQLKENGPADTGYTQYRVVVDNNGIVSFDD